MKEKVGEVFSIVRDNQPVPGCTISKTIYDKENYITYFSMARKTDISAEIFPYYKFILVNEGELEVYTQERTWNVSKGSSLITPLQIPVGMRTQDDAIYTEISIRRNDFMNEAVKAGQVFELANLIPVQEGKIVNMDVVHNNTMKFVLMSFDAGCGLSEHAAPGEAIIFALEGEGIIIYEGKEYPIQAGENFHFAKGGMHALRAEKPFKMALLLTLA